MDNEVPVSMPFMGDWDLKDLANPPDISGPWECVTRSMYDRNPGDGIRLGVRKVNPPDPNAPDGRLRMKITQRGSAYSAEGLNAAAHDHSTHGVYIGGNRFFSVTTRLAITDRCAMTLYSVVTLKADGTLETMIVCTEGGHPVHRDPPPSYRELRTWRRITA